VDRELATRLRLLQEQGLRRDLAPVSPPSARVALLEDPAGLLINLSSNDYLGLAGDPRLADAAARAARDHGVGAGASRLVSGDLAVHGELERALATIMGAERALLFGSGYLANLGVIQAIMDGPEDIIYSDALNHASIVDGCRLSRARVRTFRHRDAAHLARLLAGDAGRDGRRLIVTEGVFSMDGDEAPLAEICGLAREHGAWVMLDEAHAFGLLGPGGGGLARELGLEDEVQVRVGTLGKAAGSYGAFVAGTATLRHYLVNRARSFIYSTALPPPAAAASLRALEIISGEEGERLRADLTGAARQLRAGLTDQGWRVPGGRAAIIPIMVGDPDGAMDLAARMRQEGVLARAMRYPTVGRGQDRLRLVVSAAHAGALVQRTLEVFGGVAVSSPP